MNRWGIPADVEQAVLARDKEVCIYCHVPMVAKGPPSAPRRNVGTWEHIINDSRIATVANVARCCNACNSSKGIKSLSEWLRSTYCKQRRITERTIASIARRALRSRRRTA